MEIKLEYIKPVGDKIIIEAYTPPKNGEWEMPEETYTPTPVVGTVVAIGDKSVYKVGDMVFFRRYAIDELKFTINGQIQIVSLISDDEVVGILQNNG